MSPRLHRAFSSDGIFVLTLLIPGAMSAFGVLTIGSLSIVAIALAIGLGGSVAARAMDALYGGCAVPDARSRDLTQRAPLPIGQRHRCGGRRAGVSGPSSRLRRGRRVLILGGITYASELRLSLRHEAGRWLLGQRPPTANEALPLGLLAEAMRFSEQGDHYVSIVVADSAVRVLDARSSASSGSEAQLLWDALVDEIAAVVAGTTVPTYDDSTAVIKAAGALIAERSLRPGEWSSGRRTRRLAGGRFDRWAVEHPFVVDEVEGELHRLEVLVALVHVDVEAHLAAFLDHRCEPQQDAIVGDDDRAIVVGDQCLVARVDELHGRDVLGRLDQFGLNVELDRCAFAPRFDEDR